ncbi:neuronal acetylcholine receptor subunit alpha-10-like isoform X2 [Symsagittifera roscoffensis]
MYSTPTILITVTVIVLLMATELLGKESPSTTQLTTGSSSKVNKDKFNEAALLEHLLHSYDSRARPVKNISTTIFLDLSMYLVQILKLSEKEQVLLSNVWLILTWQDEFLRWNASEWGMDRIRIPARHLWLPDLTLYNNAQEADPILANMFASTAVASHDGSVTLWPRPLILQSNCRIDVLYFPFDVQHCYLKFSSWAYSAIQVNLTSTEGAIYLDDYIPSTEWQLLVAYTEVSYITYIEGDGGYSFVKFNIKMRRKALYYVVNLIMPCLMLTLVMLFGQYLPCNSGDSKVQLGTALFTSMCVFLLLVGTMMPPSDVQPLLGLYYGVTLLLITTSTALNVLVLNVVNRDTPVPHWVKVLFLQYMARIVAPSYHKKYKVLINSPTHSTDGGFTGGGFEKPMLQSNSATYDGDLDLLHNNCTTNYNNETNKTELKIFHYVPNGSSQFYVTQNGCGHLTPARCPYEQATGSESVTGEKYPQRSPTRPSPETPWQQTSDSCSYRLANQNSCGSTRYGIADSPIRELVTNVKPTKLDDNGRLLVEMKSHLGEIRGILAKIASVMGQKNDEEGVRNDWLDIGIVLDRILVILFTIFTVMMSLFVYGMYPSQLVNSLSNNDAR